MRESIYDYIESIKSGAGVVLGYQVMKDKDYFSKRYQKHLKIKASDKPYDGASGAMDIDSFGWLFHDVACREGCFSDGTPCTNWQASKILSDILKSELCSSFEQIRKRQLPYWLPIRRLKMSETCV